jgi:hypothetical protein
MKKTWFRWTEAEDSIIREHYNTSGVDQCCELLRQRTRSSIICRALYIGVALPRTTPRGHFERKFRVTPGCWLWTAKLDKRGYGFSKHDGKKLGAHRHSYILYVGPIPEGMFVCHRCDNPTCVNPDHLFLGTREDNIDDMLKKGRHKNYSTFKKGHGKLTDEQALMIIQSGSRASDLAKMLGVDASLISHIRHGRARKHLHENAE